MTATAEPVIIHDRRGSPSDATPEPTQARPARLPPAPSLTPPRAIHIGGTPAGEVHRRYDETLYAVVETSSQFTGNNRHACVVVERPPPQGITADWARFVPSEWQGEVARCRKFEESTLQRLRERLGNSLADAREKASAARHQAAKRVAMGFPPSSDPSAPPPLTDEEVEEQWHAAEVVIRNTAVMLARKLRAEGVLALGAAMEESARRIDAALDEVIAREGVSSSWLLTSDAAFALRFKGARIRQCEAEFQNRERNGNGPTFDRVETTLAQLNLAEFFPAL